MARFDKDKPAPTSRLYTVHDTDGSPMGQVWSVEEPAGEALDEWRLYLGIAARWARLRQQFDERVLARVSGGA